MYTVRLRCLITLCFFFFQAEDGIRDLTVTGVQTCALPISLPDIASIGSPEAVVRTRPDVAAAERQAAAQGALVGAAKSSYLPKISIGGKIGRASCRERV